MKNPLTFRIESGLGAIFIIAFAGFFIGLFFVFTKNFDSELSVSNSSSASVYGSPQERTQADAWIKQNHITGIPSGPMRMRYLIDKYPDRPWTQ